MTCFITCGLNIEVEARGLGVKVCQCELPQGVMFQTFGWSLTYKPEEKLSGHCHWGLFHI